MWRTHSPKQFCQRASCFICHYWKTELVPQLKVYYVHLATLPLSILLEEQTLARVQCLARAFAKQSRSHKSPALKKGHKCRCQPVTTVREPFASEFPSLPKIRSTKSVFSGRVLVADAAVWRTTLVDVPVCGKNELSMLHYQDFTTEVWHCYKRLNGGCWVQVAGVCSSGPRKLSRIFVTSSEWWYILNEIKEAYRMEWYFSDHVAYRLYKHSSAKLSASWDLFACISPEKAVLGGRFMQVCFSSV